MRSSTDVDFTRAASGALHLGVTLQAEVRIVLDQELSIDRAMRTMAHDTAFAHRLMLEDVRTALGGMALEAGGVLAAERRAPARVRKPAMRVMALRAGHLAFRDGMMTGQAEVTAHLGVAVEADHLLRPGSGR